MLTDAGPVAAGTVIVATGPWLADLLRLAPTKPGRGWLLRTQRLEFAPASPAWLAAWMHGEPVPAAFDELRPDRFTTTRSTT